MFFPVRLDDPGKVKLIGVEPGIPKGLDDIWLKKKSVNVWQRIFLLYLGWVDSPFEIIKKLNFH